MMSEYLIPGLHFVKLLPHQSLSSFPPSRQHACEEAPSSYFRRHCAVYLYAYMVYFQVSTSTGVISHFVNLQVVVPEAFILGSGELHVDMGSTINLVCIIEKVNKEVIYS